MAFVKPVSMCRKQALTRVLAPASALLLSLACPLALAEKTMSKVADLRYGVALFNYYQNQNLEALTELMVAKEKGGIKGHGDNPEIMEGGFCMAYGMEHKAGDIFERLLDANRPERTRNAAWYNLAKMRYSHEDWTGAEQALSKITDKAEENVALEKATLGINLALKQGRITDAESALNDKVLKNDPKWLPYLQFNIASAYSRQGNFEKAIPYYNKLLKLQSKEPEYLALYDKAMTATGYAYLLSKDTEAAVRYFSKVRIDSPLSSRALLGYGWAAAEQGDYMLALRPWHALSERSMIDENTQEVLIAIPYAYEKMGHSGLALEGFQTAEASYQYEMQVLSDVIAHVQQHTILEALTQDRSNDIEWLVYAQNNQLSPHLSYLVELFSKENFVGAVNELRDLLAIKMQFQRWEGKLDFYASMLNERERNRSEQLDFILNKGLDEKITSMESERDKLSAQIFQLKKNYEFLSLLDPESSDKMERILRAESNAELLSKARDQQGIQVMPDDDLAELRETLRRQKGFMIWHSQAMYDERLWRSEQELAALNNHLSSIRQTQERIQKIVDKNVDLQALRDRISASKQRLQVQLVNLDKTIEQSQNILLDNVISILSKQRVRLKQYLAQSRLSIARILDAASNSEEQARPPKPADAGDNQVEEGGTQ